MAGRLHSCGPRNRRVLDLGFELVLHQKWLFEGIDTPELRGGTTLTKAAARLARDVAREWVQEAMEDGGAVFVSETYRGSTGDPLATSSALETVQA